MFTGIIEEVGTIKKIQSGSHSAVLTIAAQKVLSDVHIGDSIAVSGICLTVTRAAHTDFTVDVMHETLDRSVLGSLKIGSAVNLERAVQLGGRLGGHIVAGHIDGTGTIADIQKDDNAVWFNIQTTPQILRYIVEKGSIAIDGISLTVATVSNSSFSVSVIPHTAACTTLCQRKKGEAVNLENDCVGKYIEKLMQPKPDTKADNKKVNSGLTMDFLKKYAF